MTQSIELRIKTPCTQSWESMKPTEQGRFCSSCAKTVVDFTQLNDAQLLEALKEAAPGNICGRFHAHQLNREILPPPNLTGHSFFAPLMSGLLSIGVFGYTNAQNKPSLTHSQATLHSWGIEQEDQAISKMADSAAPHTSLYLLRGKVVDKESNEPLAFVNIWSEKFQTGVTTDLNGAFSLELPVPPHGETILLEISFVGYQRLEYLVSPDMLKSGSPVTITMEGGIVLGGTHIHYEEQPRWKRLFKRR